MRTVDYIDGRVVIIDQNRLPAELKMVEIEDYREVAEAIRTMKVRGAPALGVTAALGIALGARSIDAADFGSFYSELQNVAAEIRATRPTAVNLFWGVDRMMAAAERLQDRPVDEIKMELDRLARSMVEEDEDACRQLGRIGGELLSDGDSVLTHCNAGGLACVGYGTALGVIRGAIESGKKLRVYADETRPRLQGMRLTAWELAQDGVDVTIIADNMAGSLMRRGKIDACVVGADRIAANGDTANKIGTYTVAVLAKAHSIPIYVAAPTSTVDLTLASGDEILIEERSPEEMTHIEGCRIAPVGVPVLNPAFDVTPAELITAIVTERGIARAPYTESLARLRCIGTPLSRY
ncbi:MAG: S-methyl-5-thioribose-1-phosphate isomerase [Armatimonadetes bacterium]|nr:S-methyl-5-thioribose-1-phosphate isomerase [Armatimonadota bacterium]